MNLIQNGNPVSMTSLELVEFINRHRKQQADAVGADFPSDGFAVLQHKDFLAKVPKVLGPTSAKFSADLSDGYGRPRTAFCFPKREACLMAMSYSYELQAAVFDRMTALEQSVTSHVPAIPQTLSEALRLAADQAEQIEQQQAALAIAAPKAAFVDQYVENTGSMSFRQAAKLLKANERRFRQLLLDKGVMYYLSGTLTPYQHHIDAGRFQVKTGTSERNQHAFTQARFTPKGLQWVAGLWAAYQMEVAA